MCGYLWERRTALDEWLLTNAFGPSLSPLPDDFKPLPLTALIEDSEEYKNDALHSHSIGARLKGTEFCLRCQ